MTPGAIFHLTISVSTRGPHIYRVEQTVAPLGGRGTMLCWPKPTEQSKVHRIKAQLARRAALEISIQGVWESQGSGRLSRAIPQTHGQQWLGQKHLSEQLIRPLLLLPPPDIYAWADIRQWELKNWGLEGTVDNTGPILAEREDTQKLACLLALNVLCQAKNFGAWVGFLRTVGEQRWGEMNTAPIGNTGLRVLTVLHLPDCWRAGEDRALLHFFILRKQDCPVEPLDLQKTPHTNDKFQAESQVTSALMGRKTKSPPVRLFRSSLCTGILGLFGLSGPVTVWQAE